ncbi:MAG: hypothetical protein C4289_01840 [Chloroflexota bacterium]
MGTGGQLYGTVRSTTRASGSGALEAQHAVPLPLPDQARGTVHVRRWTGVVRPYWDGRTSRMLLMQVRHEGEIVDPCAPDWFSQSAPQQELTGRARPSN